MRIVSYSNAGNSEQETLKMGFDLIDFAVELNRRAKIEED